MKSWLEDNDLEMYSAHIEGKSAIAERFIRILRNKIYKYMILISQNMYINKLDNLVNEYKNTYHTTNKMKPADINRAHTVILIKRTRKKMLNLRLVTR